MQDQVRQSINQRNIFLNKYFNLILSFLLIIVLIFSYILIIKPKHNAARIIIKENLRNQQILFNQQQKKLDTLKIIYDTFSKISPDELTKFNSVLPYKYKQEQLFGEFEEIANKNGWILKSVNLSYPDELPAGRVVPAISQDGNFFGSLNPNVGRIDINLSFIGLDYQGLKKLLSVLETNLRLFDVSQVSFSGGSGVDLTLTTYYYKLNN